MKKPIILHVTPSLMIGGAEKLLLDLLTIFKQDHKFEHQVVYFKTGPHLALLNQLKIKSYHVTGLVKYWDLICFYKLYRLIKTIKPYKIHALLWSANFYSRLIGHFLKIPTICAIHSNYNSGNVTKDHWLKLKLDKLTLKFASKIITVSPAIQNKLKMPHYQLKPAQIISINNGVNLPKIIKNNNFKKQFTIGHVGRLVPVKNQVLLIEALAIIQNQAPDFKAIIIGEGPLATALKALVYQKKMCTKVSFVKTNLPENYYPHFDCFVLPSHQEGQSIALLEAMSWGITPIVTSQNSKHDIVQNLYNGLICQPNNAQALAQQILRIYYNQALNLKLGQTALQTIKQKFNLMRTAQQYLKLFES